MSAQEFSLDSDESDEDFCPEKEGATTDSGSDEEFEDDLEDSASTSNKQCHKKSVYLKENKTKCNGSNSNRLKDDELNPKSSEQDPSKIDSLWNDFLNDVKTTKKIESSSDEIQENFGQNSNTSEKREVQHKDVNNKNRGNIKPMLSCYGQKRAHSPSRLDSLLNQIDKKKKVSVLEKSQMDWNNFKRDEGIQEDLQTYNKGKEGFLGRQDFLQRTDLRQFEAEKNLRTTRRTK